MDMPHLDLDSLTFLSTDVVVADLSCTGLPFSRSFHVVATVRETIYGGLRPGAKLDQLSEFLEFYSPVLDGQRVILFLDSRPHKPYFLSPEASKSPFAVVSSGMYLIDQYKHVHEYSQQSNPGGYIAEGYAMGFPSVVPGRAVDLALPSLPDVKEKIVASFGNTQAMHALLDRATVHDVPAMLALLESRKEAARCWFLGYDAVAQRILEIIQSFGDPELLLRISSTVKNLRSPFQFIAPTLDKGVDQSRVKFLILTMVDRKAETQLRISAVELLAEVGGFSPALKVPGALDLSKNQWLSNSAVEINTSAKNVFDDASADSRLRAGCIKLLRLDKPEVIADMKGVYGQTRSGVLRFAVEKSFLAVSDVLYLSLRPRGGPVASIVSVPSHECLNLSTGEIAFIGSYEDTKGYTARISAAFVPGDRDWLPEKQYFLLRDAETGKSILRKEAEGIGSSGGGGETVIKMDEITQLPPGLYDLTLRVEWKGSVISEGYPLRLKVTETTSGRELSPAVSQEF